MADASYRVLIDGLIVERSEQLALKKPSEAFEDIVNSFVALPFDLDIDDIQAGITDGSNDGQIDAMFVVVNGTALSDENFEEDFPEKGPVEINLLIVQSKATDSFEETPLKIVRTTVRDLLNLNLDYAMAVPGYNDRLQAKFNLARRALLKSAGRTAQITARVYYATRASTEKIHPQVQSAGGQLLADLQSLLTTQDVQIVYWGARELIELSRQPIVRTRDLTVQDFIGSDTGDSYVCLATINAIMAFLSDEHGGLLRGLFEANVRDFLGHKAEVNEAIRETLPALVQEDFWWFNNGITLIADDVDPKGKKFALREPLLVNGLQTSNVVFQFMRDGLVDEKVRQRTGTKKVLVKIIVPPSEAVRDGIIKATNNQTYIPKPYLRGMDVVQRNIEDHLKTTGLFYERRKNHYRNLAKPRNKIITLTELSQTLMATLLFRPGDARARPNSLLKDDSIYASLFDESHPIEIFERIIVAKRRVNTILQLQYPELGSGFRNDTIFHVLAYLSSSRFQNVKHAVYGWKTLMLSNYEISCAIHVVVALYRMRGGNERVAKAPAFQSAVLNEAAKAREGGQHTSPFTFSADSDVSYTVIWDGDGQLIDTGWIVASGEILRPSFISFSDDEIELAADL